MPVVLEALIWPKLKPDCFVQFTGSQNKYEKIWRLKGTIPYFLLEYKVVGIILGMVASFFGIQSVSSQPDYFNDGQNHADSADLLYRKGNLSTWYLGKDLSPGSLFTYKVCDMILVIPESPDHCYHISLEFIDVLKGSHGDLWVVQAVMDHQNKRAYSIFQISPITFDITTDGTSIPYADSVSRTIFWIGKFANEFGQKSLTVGKSWGNVATHTAPNTELIVRNEEIINLKEQQVHTFVLGYNLIESSTVYISKNFPFPIKATIYKPTASHQNIPLQFTIELVNYRNDLLRDFSIQTVPIQNELIGSINNFEKEVLLNENFGNKTINSDQIDDNGSDTANLEEGTLLFDPDYLDRLYLEELFERFLKEHFDNDSEDLGIDLTAFLDFLNKTDPTIINNQNFTVP